MPTEVKMPRLSLTMEVGTVIQWLKKPGDSVAKGEDLAEIETDKVNVVMESPATGYLRDLLVVAGVQVPCDTTIAVLTASADEVLAGVTPTGDGGEIAGVPTGGALDVAVTPDSGSRAHVNASPAAKNLARQLGIDLGGLIGTGPGGRIGLEDVQRAADARPAVSAAPAARATTGDGGSEVVPLNSMRAAMARQMIASVATVPQFTVHRRVDLSGALRMRTARLAGASGRAPVVIDLIHFAAIRALVEHRDVNASFQAGVGAERGAIVLHHAVHLGVAVALPDGLIVPVIRDAHCMSLDELTGARVRLQEQAQSGRLPADALSGATFTVSNLGTMNVDDFTAIVNPPEAAILAVGRMQDSLVVRDGAIHIVPLVSLTVTADHRVLDGSKVASFLNALVENLDRVGAKP
jgi:pyruvate dehydrogenase E2 component (dihydrolipoamide acetyltransferase)